MAATVCAIISGHPSFGGPPWLLEQAVTQAGMWERLADACARSGRDPAGLSVVVLPELLCFDGQAGTDPALVEHLVDLLGERGYEQVAVGMTVGNEDTWLDGRELSRIARVAGYRLATDYRREYELIDLAHDVVGAAFGPASVLHGSRLARRWVEADFRITFAKNRTHEEYAYALCLHTLLGVLPLRDKPYHYRGRLKPWDVGVELLRCTPPQFALIDAVSSSHGNWASRAPETLTTATIIGSPDVLLADWVGALKMGLDPHVSALNDRALTEVGLPDAYDIVGDLSTYEGWRNVHPALLESTRVLNDSVGVTRVLAPLTTRVDRALFPFKSVALERANRLLSSLLAPASGDPLAESAALWLHAGLAAGIEGFDAWRTIFAKEQLRWRDVPLDIDLGAFALADYDAVDAEVEPLEQLIQATPGDHSGLRWRHVDGSVLFQFRRVLPIGFAQFVERVDISRAIHYMQDYIGGRCVATARDDRGRVTHQAERNIYLPQPNYVALYGGSVIDVTKLERIRYSDDEQRIRWRTLHSANGSARYDDGSVRFADVDGQYTEVTIVGRQQFTLPLFWQAVNLDRMPEIRDLLIADAYFTFFDGTMSKAAYDGRQYRVGQPWSDEEGERDHRGLPQTSSLDAAATVHRVGGLVRRLATSGDASPTASAREYTLDEHGFRHFAPASVPAASAHRPGSLERFMTELNSAVARDLGLDESE